MTAGLAAGTPPVQGGGDASHGALAMDRQLAVVTTLEAYILAQRKGKTLDYGRH
jgi:hypothetical protein